MRRKRDLQPRLTPHTPQEVRTLAAFDAADLKRTVWRLAFELALSNFTYAVVLQVATFTLRTLMIHISNISFVVFRCLSDVTQTRII